MDTAPRELSSIGRFRHIGFSAEQLGSFQYGALEWQVLESVKRVVVNENTNRSLGRQKVGDTVNDLVQALPPRQRRIVPAVHRFALARDFGSCRATSFSMLTVLVSCE